MIELNESFLYDPDAPLEEVEGAVILAQYHRKKGDGAAVLPSSLNQKCLGQIRRFFRPGRHKTLVRCVATMLCIVLFLNITPSGMIQAANGPFFFYNLSKDMNFYLDIEYARRKPNPVYTTAPLPEPDSVSPLKGMLPEGYELHRFRASPDGFDCQYRIDKATYISFQAYHPDGSPRMFYFLSTVSDLNVNGYPGLLISCNMDLTCQTLWFDFEQEIAYAFRSNGLEIREHLAMVDQLSRDPNWIANVLGGNL